VIFEPGLIRRIESSSAGVTLATAAAFVNRAAGVSLDDLDDDQLDELESAPRAGSPAPPTTSPPSTERRWAADQ
jgi:hypothetical protein